MTETTKVEMLDDAALDAVAGGLPKAEAPHGNPRLSHGPAQDSHGGNPAPAYCQFSINNCTSGPVMSNQSFASSGAATKG